MKIGPPITIADLLRAWHGLDARGDTTIVAIARALGLTSEDSSQFPLGAQPGTDRQQLTTQLIDDWQKECETEEPSEPIAEAISGPEDDAESKPMRLERISQASSIPPDEAERLLGGVTPLSLPDHSQPLAAPRPPPLLKQQRARSTLMAALSTARGVGEIDQQRLVSQVARGAALTELPRTPALTMARGVQVLLDRGAGMLPFRSDLVDIEREIRRVAASSQLEVLSFAARPGGRVGRGPRRRWQPYFEEHRPSPGSRIVCVTDLGITDHGEPGDMCSDSDWLTFQRRLNRLGCPLIVLVPYGPHRWPRRLSRRLCLVPWDRHTNAAQIAAALRSHRGLNREQR